MTHPLRIAVCGYGRHGKNTVAKHLADMLGLRYAQSTSEAAAMLVFRQIGKRWGYRTAQECWDDRHAHREEWADIIWRYNQPHGISLYEDMLAENDIIEGIRNADELTACKVRGIVDVSVWVDAAKRLPPEGQGSCTLKLEDCDHVIDNNGTHSDLVALSLPPLLAVLRRAKFELHPDATARARQLAP